MMKRSRSNVRRSCVAVLPLLLFVPLRAQDSGAPAVVEKTGQHFVLSFHGGSESLAQSALDVVEADFPIVVELLGAKDESSPARLLPVHLYRTIEGYQAADLELTHGKFQRNLAMTEWTTASSHVALQPPCRDETLRAIGLPGQTVAMLAWEACHLVRRELCPNFLDHPKWFEDGLAAWTASQVLEQRYPCGSAESAPLFANDMVLVQNLQRAGKLPPAADVLADRIDDLDMNDRYATRALFFRFLRSGARNDRLKRIVDAIRRTNGGSQYATEVLAAEQEILGATLDAEFANYVHELRPKWAEPFRSLTTARAQWHQIAYADKNAIAWNHDPIEGGGIDVSGSLRILPGEKSQLNFLFARSDTGFYSIAFTADFGINVFDYQTSTDHWDVVGSGEFKGLRVGYSSAFEVHASGRNLVVQLDSRRWDFELPRTLPESIAWGVGAQNGSAGLWSGVKVAAAGKH